jgi:polysaccharide chain length determinant protein (PEP-CTERM system associated)
MDELIQQSLRRLRGMWHRRWIGLAAAWIVAIVGVVLVYRFPERYEASARVYVDTQSVLRPLLAGLSIQPNLDEQVALVSRTLINRPNIEKLVRMADLDLAVKSGPEHEELVDNVMKSVHLNGDVKTNLYVISYRDANPQQATKVVQSLVSIFVESSLGNKRQDTRDAVKFIDEQKRQYEVSLKNAEDRLKDFRLKYLGVAGQGNSQDYFGRLAALSNDIETARVELRAASEARDSYKRDLAGETPVLLPEGPQAAGDSMAIADIDARLAAQKAQLDTLLQRYTDEHPDVVGARRVIKQLEEQRAKEQRAEQAAATSGNARVAPAGTSPVYQQMKVSLADAEANVASLRAKLASYESQYAQLKSAARLVPQAEAEFAQLNRDYDVQKKTYETLLARRESAAIGEGVQDAGGTQFRVIDPPRVSPTPVAPGRMALLGVVLLGAIGAGLAAAFVANELRPIFQDVDSLREATQRPILGMVTVLPNEASGRRKRRERFLFAGGAGGLAASFAVVFALVFWFGVIA